MPANKRVYNNDGRIPTLKTLNILLPVEDLIAYTRVVQPYCKQGPGNFSDCLRGPDVLNLLVFHIQDSNF